MNRIAQDRIERFERRDDLAEALYRRMRGEEPTGGASIYRTAKLNHLELLSRTNLGVSGSGDFEVILEETLQKRVVDYFEPAKANYQALGREISFSSFQPHSVGALEFPALRQIADCGEVLSGAINDNGETVAAVTIGRRAEVSRQVVVNDDLRALDDIARLVAIAARLSENAVSFTVLRGVSGLGPTLVDGLPLFDPAHGNIAPAGALEASRLAAAIALLRKQRSHEGALLNVEPAILLVGPDNEATALALVAELTAGAKPRLRLLVDAHLGTEFYVAADPAVRAALVYGRVGGSAPLLVGRRDFRNEGYEFRATSDFGCGPCDFRAIVRGAGV